jgi:hypothetical protein
MALVSICRVHDANIGSAYCDLRFNAANEEKIERSNPLVSEPRRVCSAIQYFGTSGLGCAPRKPGTEARITSGQA